MRILLIAFTLAGCTVANPGHVVCGSTSCVELDDKGGVVSTTPGGGVPGVCSGADVACTTHGDCCSGRCEPVTGAGRVACTNYCFADGAACTRAQDCCSLGCFGGKCGGGLCRVYNEACTTNAECCSNICTGGLCAIDRSNTDCRPTGETCTSGPGSGCCTDVCNESLDPPRCMHAVDTCRAQGAACMRDQDCCRGVCDPATKTCKTPCKPNGAMCTASGECCNGNCTGGVCGPPVMSCQPVGSACTLSAQCCTGLCLGGLCDALIK